MTPRHFLDFINQFIAIYQEKRADLEEQQSHLVNGLTKIRETVEQVEELQKSLSFKRAELESKNNEANSKLKQMVIDQQEAEKKKQDSQELQKLLLVRSRSKGGKISDLQITLLIIKRNKRSKYPSNEPLSWKIFPALSPLSWKLSKVKALQMFLLESLS